VALSEYLARPRIANLLSDDTALRGFSAGHPVPTWPLGLLSVLVRRSVSDRMKLLADTRSDSGIGPKQASTHSQSRTPCRPALKLPSPAQLKTQELSAVPPLQRGRAMLPVCIVSFNTAED